MIDVLAAMHAMAARGPEWAGWVDRLPRLTRSYLDDWELRVDGEPTHGFCSMVLPVCGQGGVPCILKISFPSAESEHEHIALRRWDGDGAVRLLRADPPRRALLLERLHRQCEATADPELLKLYQDLKSYPIPARSGPLPPDSVAIPFKLLLFVVMDGWSTLIHGLVMTYK